jgi:hypothetical protein
VNEIIAKRMNKKQQVRWNRHTVQAFIEVRIHVLNGTLEDAFRYWHQGFHQSYVGPRLLYQLDHPTTLGWADLYVRNDPTHSGQALGTVDGVRG